MTAQTLLEELDALGVVAIPQGKDLVIRPASRVPSDLKERLKQHKLEIVEEIYHLRAERVLRDICDDYEPGTILWLEGNAPLLYETLTATLPNLISELWNKHAPLGEFDAALAKLLDAHRLAVALFRRRLQMKRGEHANCE